MIKRLLSITLSTAIIMAAGAGSALAARASEASGEGTTAQTQAEALSPETLSDALSDVFTDAAGNVIPSDTAQALENADMGATDILGGSDTELAGDAADTLQLPGGDSVDEMNKSTINAVFDSTYLFDEEDAIVYLKEAATVKAEPFDEAEDLLSLDKYLSIHLTGSNSLKYWEVKVGNTIGYLDSAVLTRDQAEIEALKEEDLRREETEAQSKIEQEESIAEKAFEAREEWTEALKESRRAELANQTRSLYWDGPVLTRSKGSVYGPSGKETYYNLNMSGCVRNMNRRGYYYEVWVRNDGCKMFGDYIMCASNLGVHPFGSLVECSLGTCIVVDTGGFAAGNPNQLDIAVTW